MKKIILAYSGGLDTSVAIRWLREKDFDVIACLVDVGQKGDFDKARAKAKKIGASKVYVIDAKQEFVKDFVFPALKADAVYESKYFLATALSRPLIAAKLADVAKKERAQYVAHGCTGKGNDQVRIEVSLGALAPGLEVIAPLRIWDFASRVSIGCTAIRRWRMWNCLWSTGVSAREHDATSPCKHSTQWDWRHGPGIGHRSCREVSNREWRSLAHW